MANILILQLKAQEIGTIESIEGTFHFINSNNIEQDLEIFDSILLNQPYFLKSNVTVSISLNDGTFITFENQSAFEFLEYNDIDKPNPLIILKVDKGNFIIETGDIPKKRKNSSKIITTLGSLILNGTCVSASFNNNKSDIFLMTDSYGNQGELLLESDNGEILNVEPDAGISVSDGQVNKVEIDNSTLEKLNKLNEDIVNTSIINEDQISLIVEQKISAGKVADLNGDGVIDSNDTNILKEQIIGKKNTKIDKIINNTSSNSNLLTNIITKSSNENSVNLLEKVISVKPDITTNVIETLTVNNVNKLTEISSLNESIVTKVVDVISTNQNTNDTQLSNILSKVDNNIASKLMEKVIDNKPEILVDVISKVSTTDSTKISSLVSSNQELNSKLNNKVVEIISSDPNGKDKLKQLVTGQDNSLSSNILTNINIVNPELAQATIKESLQESPNKMTEILTSSLTSTDNSLSDIIINESIASGKNEIISNVVEELKTTNTDSSLDQTLIATLGDKINQQTDILISEGEIEEENFDLTSLVQENLASPN